ncbi:hypothetical protein B0H19DRAFT_1233413 [Mycena capillaripes]|nr:hypothetical protein B0H19DRAFT_1233413 [Mycena capillaripes]
MPRPLSNRSPTRPDWSRSQLTYWAQERSLEQAKELPAQTKSKYTLTPCQSRPEDVPEEEESHRESLGRISETEVRATGNWKPKTGKPEGVGNRTPGGRPDNRKAGPGRPGISGRRQRKSVVVRPVVPDRRVRTRGQGSDRRRRKSGGQEQWMYCERAAVSGASLCGSGPRPEDGRSSARPMGSGGAPAAGTEHRGGVWAYCEEVTISGMSLYGSRPHLRVQISSSVECMKVKKGLPW